MKIAPLFQNLALHSRRVFSGLLLSRVSGFGRDLVMALAFGDHPSVAAFMVAFRFSNLLRRLVAEGPIQVAFIPHFEELRLKSQSKALFFFCKLVFLLTLVLLSVIFLVEGGISYSFAFISLSGETKEILLLTKWLFPAILFICLYGLNTALLHCYDVFFIPSFAPFICNIIWIGAALALRKGAVEPAMVSLAKCVTWGFFGQWLFTLPPTVQSIYFNLQEKIKGFNFKLSEEVQGLLKSFSLGAIGVGAVQINSFIDSLFARYADVRGPIYLWYSIRLEQLALAIFGIACVSSVVPRLSRAIKGNDQEGAQSLFSFSYQRTLLIMIPCTFAILSLGAPSINFIYGRGNFSPFAVSETSLCLWAYGLGLLPNTMVILYSALFYAKGDFKTPTLASIFSVLINICLNSLFVFVFQMGAISIAITTSLSSWANMWILQKLERGFFFKGGYSRKKMAALCLVSFSSFLLTCFADQFFFKGANLALFMQKEGFFPRTLSSQVIILLVEAFVFSVSLAGLSFLLKQREVLELFRFFSPFPLLRKKRELKEQ
ncbi:MAG: murein biosynthesis integral membrane protein MurJ [Ignavibacteriae bacterium]|nr:murein biosynthesis integral membrane protein MurJ [Ignavibacteriota bacterium]